MASKILLNIHQMSWFLSLQGDFKVLGILSAEHSWGRVKTIKSGKMSAFNSDISEKQSIVYTYICIEEATILRTLSHTYSKDVSHSHSRKYEEYAFEYQLDH